MQGNVSKRISEKQLGNSTEIRVAYVYELVTVLSHTSRLAVYTHLLI